MAGIRLDYVQNLQQQMRLSPQMIQSISLMAMPAEELREYIYAEAEKNPAIEITREPTWEPPSIRLSPRSGNASESDEWQAFLESAPAPPESLQEHLLAQLSLLNLDDDERRIGERIIQNLDPRGYNNSEPENLLTATDPLSLLTKMLDIIRRLDPPGTACSDLRESLFIQAEISTEAPPLALTILRSHFDVLEKKRPALICKALQSRGIACSSEETEHALNFIRSLEPFPGRQFEAASGSVHFVVPEVEVRKATEEEKNENGSAFIIEFLSGNIPQIGISSLYEDLSGQQNKDVSSRKFAGEAVKQAQWVIETLHMRTKAIHSAMQAIVIRQELFFRKGPGHLCPLRMKDIAEEIGVHETTVSRIANGKYVQCEWGIFEIKYFFTNAVSSNIHEKKKKIRQAESDTEPHITKRGEEQNIPGSKESAKHLLKAIIEEHEKKGGKKLSDAKLSELLAQRGINIARRTVAKYRSELNIYSSFDRS
ncbi:RNA polymerase factor sigma-54 [Treponema sp. OMZ 840]|uniref:RNA polymerase factor sigma-54 n=1 Tax=Treponema sp. OMZ 840 TaxID=244313 RepID=UPI003D8E8E71